MRSFLRLGLVGCLSMLACGPGNAGGTSSNGATTTSTGPDPTETSDSSSDPSTGDGDGDLESSEDTGFVPPTDLEACSICDTFAQDCPDGEKCVPGPNRGGSCNPQSCREVVGDKQPSEPCSLVDNSDDCGESSWCYPGRFEDDSPAVCIEFCLGTADDASCSNPDEVCVIDTASYDGELGCRPRCNPLAPEGCLADEVCTIGTSEQKDFGCLIANAELAAGAVCNHDQDCAAGLCLDADELPDCGTVRCCSSFCDVLAPDCPDGSECVAIELADNPESTVGVCRIPD
jgi:hypothetical protein